MGENTIKKRIYDALLYAGATGLTCEQIELIAGVSHANATGRIFELRKAGLIVRTEHKRETLKGNEAAIYAVIEQPTESEK